MRNVRKITIERNELNIHVLHSNILELDEQISADKLHLVSKPLRNALIQLKKNKKRLLIDRTKTAIYQFIFSSDENPKQDFSDYISKKVNRDFNYLNNLFLGRNGVTIKEYLVARQIEYFKELLVYSDLIISDIVYKLQSSGETQLTNQFIMETGVSPAFYRLLRNVSSGKSKNV